MTNIITNTAAAAFDIDAYIDALDISVIENPAEGFSFDETKLLSDPCSHDAGTVHNSEEAAARCIARLVYDDLDDLIEARAEAGLDDDEDEVEKRFVFKVRKYPVIADGGETVKFVTYLAAESTGACGEEITASEHDCRETAEDHIASLIVETSYEKEFDEYADAFSRDAVSIGALNFDALTSGEVKVETRDGLEYLRGALSWHLARAAA